MSSVTITGNASGTAVFTVASPATSTNRTLTLPDETSTLATQAYASNASNLSSGTVNTARLGTGTADSTTFLRGDGAYAFLTLPNGTLSAGSTYAGSSLRRGGDSGGGYSPAAFTLTNWDEHQTGVVSREGQAALPETVIYRNMIDLLIEAVKELTARVEKLEGR